MYIYNVNYFTVIASNDGDDDDTPSQSQVDEDEYSISRIIKSRLSLSGKGKSIITRFHFILYSHLLF